MHALISTAALAERLSCPNAGDRLRLFDATVHLRPAQPGPYVAESGRADHETAHIPSAAFVDLARDLSDTGSPLRFTMPTAHRPGSGAVGVRAVERPRWRGLQQPVADVGAAAVVDAPVDGPRRRAADGTGRVMPDCVRSGT